MTSRLLKGSKEIYKDKNLIIDLEYVEGGYRISIYPYNDHGIISTEVINKKGMTNIISILKEIVK